MPNISIYNRDFGPYNPQNILFQPTASVRTASSIYTLMHFCEVAINMLGGCKTLCA